MSTPLEGCETGLVAVMAEAVRDLVQNELDAASVLAQHEVRDGASLAVLVGRIPTARPHVLRPFIDSGATASYCHWIQIALDAPYCSRAGQVRTKGPFQHEELD